MVISNQFNQLFQNLIANSLKFKKPETPPYISITHSFHRPDEIRHYNLSKAERYFKLTFKDNGIGFSNEYAEKIFFMFQRLHGKSEFDGAGIGLSICKKIAETHKGIILASGEENEGATFEIIIPVFETLN